MECQLLVISKNFSTSPVNLKFDNTTAANLAAEILENYKGMEFIVIKLYRE